MKVDVRAGGRRLVSAIFVAAVGAVGLVPAPAAAAADRCEDGVGVTVVVDFGALGGGAPVVCVSDGAGRPAMEVVQDAGFRLDQVRTQPGFVCAIDTKPSPDASCARTPPPDSYWGLFWSNGSSTRWSYSSAGAGGLEVPDGGSIGWKWQSSSTRTTPGPAPTTGLPSSSPKPEPTKPPKPPKPTPEPTKAPADPSQSATPTASAFAAGTPSGSPTAAEKAQRADKPAEQRADKSERAEKKGDRNAAAKEDRRPTPDAATDDEQVAAGSVAQEETPLAPTSAADEGSGALTWLAGGAVLVLVAAAGVLARRRRG